jgi:hypothetical protein
MTNSRAREAAEAVIAQFWLGQVERAAHFTLANRSPTIVLHPPTEAQYAAATSVLEALLMADEPRAEVK